MKQQITTAPCDDNSITPGLYSTLAHFIRPININLYVNERKLVRSSLLSLFIGIKRIHLYGYSRWTGGGQTLALPFHQATVFPNNHQGKDDPDEDQHNVENKERLGRESEQLDPYEYCEGGNTIANTDKE